MNTRKHASASIDRPHSMQLKKNGHMTLVHSRLSTLIEHSRLVAQSRAMHEVTARNLSPYERDYLNWFHGDPLRISLNKAHAYCFQNRTQLLNDTRCGCFHCLRIFHPQWITQWIEDRMDGTAWCPYCHVDALIGEGSGYPITPEFLHRMHLYWFGNDRGAA